MPMRKGTKVLGPSRSARDAAEARRVLGSPDDILRRAERDQAREAKEEKMMGVPRRATGGKIMKKYAVGGTTTTTAKPAAPAAPRAPLSAATLATAARGKEMAAGVRKMRNWKQNRAANDAATYAAARARAAARPATNSSAAGMTKKPMPTQSQMQPASGTPMKKGGKIMKMAKGGGIESRGKTKGTEVKMAGGGKCYAKGGSIDGCATKGKTRGKMV